MSEMSFPSWGTKGFWLLALSLLWMVNRRTSRFPFSWNLSEKQKTLVSDSVCLLAVPSCVGHAESTFFKGKLKLQPQSWWKFQCLYQRHISSINACRQGGLRTPVLVKGDVSAPVSWPFITLGESTVWTPGCLLLLRTNMVTISEQGYSIKNNYLCYLFIFNYYYYSFRTLIHGKRNESICDLNFRCAHGL